MTSDRRCSRRLGHVRRRASGRRRRRASSCPRIRSATPARAARTGLQRPPYDLDQLAAMLETNTLHYRCVQAEGGRRRRPRLQAPRARRANRASPAPPTSAGRRASTRARRAGARSSSRRGGRARRRELQGADPVRPTRTSSRSAGASLEFSRDATACSTGCGTSRAHDPGPQGRPPVRPEARRQDRLVQALRPRGDVDKSDGGWSTGPSRRLRGNELLVVRNYTPRSTTTACPTTSRPSRDRRLARPGRVQRPLLRQPRGPGVRGDHRGRRRHARARGEDPRPLPGDQGRPAPHARHPGPGHPGRRGDPGQGPLREARVDVKDASFRLYKQDNALEICIAHGIPPYRSAGRSSARSAARPPRR
jgi:hypothetical protein